MDVATLGVLCAHTSGSLHHWCPWARELDGDELFNDLRWCCMRPQVRRCVLPLPPLPVMLLLLDTCGCSQQRVCVLPCMPSTRPPRPAPVCQGLEAVGRLRCSRGLAVDRYIGSFYRRVETDLNFPALSCDHAFAAKLAYEVGGGWLGAGW